MDAHAPLPAGERLATDPEVVATPLAALDLDRVPTSHHFRRNHAPFPALDADRHAVRVHGHVERPTSLDLAALRALPQVEHLVVLECAGHRRTEFDPIPDGIAWDLGAVSAAVWRGPRLADVLAAAAPRAGAVDAVLRGADPGPVGGVEGLHRYDRALPLADPALGDALLALELNGEPLPVAHGAPVRAIVPGWYAMVAVKWLVEIEVTERPYDGPWQAHDYRLWRDDLPADGVPLGAMPVSSLLTAPAAGTLAAGPGEVRGIAWGGAGGVRAVAVEVDGAPLAVELVPPAGPYGPTRFRAPWTAAPGRHELVARATDAAGDAQPDRVPWNRRGYGNNAAHRVVVEVA